MRKEFLDYSVVRNNALRLAKRICDDGFVPDIIYCSLRGGAYMANVISEYFKLVKRKKKDPRPVLFAAVVARSYTDVREASRVMVDGWTYSPDYLRAGDRILLIDDIFDSGQTINFLVDIFLEKGVPRKDVKVAVHDYKYFAYLEKQLPTQPDYWCRRHEIKSPDDDLWIHYMSHELVGLSEAELEEHYYSKDESLRDVLSIINEDNGD